jgi:hypothetical protein
MLPKMLPKMLPSIFSQNKCTDLTEEKSNPRTWDTSIIKKLPIGNNSIMGEN